MNCSPPGSSVHGISQTRILEWVAFPSQGILPAHRSNLCLLFGTPILYHWATWKALLRIENNSVMQFSFLCHHWICVFKTWLLIWLIRIIFFVSLRHKREQKTWILSAVELKPHSSSTWADWVENSEFLMVTEIVNGKALLIAKVTL